MYSIQAGGHWTWKGFGAAVGMGAVSEAISFGIGSLMAGANATGVGAALVSSYAYGFTQGTLSTLQGGDFLTSAATGAFSSLAGSGLTALSEGSDDITAAAITIAGGGVTGGFTESMLGEQGSKGQ